MNEEEMARWALLDPSGEDPGRVRPTLYVRDELLFDPGAVNGLARVDLDGLAALHGWAVTSEADEGSAESDADARSAVGEGSRTIVYRLRPLPRSEDARSAGLQAQPYETPDAWKVLQEARLQGGGSSVPGLSLNHILSTDPFKINPFKINPFKINPFKINPFKINDAGGIDSYAAMGLGGRQPVAYIGPEPAQPDPAGPIVAILDTGCGEHRWFDGGVLVEPLTASGRTIGIDDKATDPEAWPALAQPLEGLLDGAAGHGTFIAGIIRQTCPAARILPVRVSDGDGYVKESILIEALGHLLDFHRRTPIAVLSLSFGFYHETAEDPATVSELGRLLADFRAEGCVVVCSAGNEGEERPTIPAALVTGDATHVSVGALNPSRQTVALFSNIGNWVSVYAPGVSIVSTFPQTFNGSAQPSIVDPRSGLARSTLDVDDFRGGFGVWSGTSFAAPWVAGRIATHLISGLGPEAALKEVRTEIRG